MKRLGLIAGGGDLPLAIARRCEAEGRPVFVYNFLGVERPTFAADKPLPVPQDFWWRRSCWARI